MDMAEAADLKRSKQIPQKYGGSAIESSIAAIADAAALSKHKKQYQFPLVGTKKQERVPFSGGGIAATAEAAMLKLHFKNFKRMRAVQH